MYTFLTELQKRPDGIINSSATARSSLATGLALYYDRGKQGGHVYTVHRGSIDTHGRGWKYS